MTEPIDEYSVSHLREYQGHQLVSVMKEGCDLCESPTEKQYIEEMSGKFQKLCKTIKDILNKFVEKVIVSIRLRHSPCCILSNQYSMSGNMERISKCQALKPQPKNDLFGSKKILEINPRNEIIQRLKQLIDEDESNVFARDIVWLIFETSLLQSGYALPTPAVYCSRIHQMMMMGLNLDLDEQALPVEANKLKQFQLETDQTGDAETRYPNLFEVD